MASANAPLLDQTYLSVSSFAEDALTIFESGIASGLQMEPQSYALDLDGLGDAGAAIHAAEMTMPTLSYSAVEKIASTQLFGIFLDQQEHHILATSVMPAAQLPGLVGNDIGHPLLVPQAFPAQKSDPIWFVAGLEPKTGSMQFAFVHGMRGTLLCSTTMFDPLLIGLHPTLLFAALNWKLILKFLKLAAIMTLMAIALHPGTAAVAWPWIAMAIVSAVALYFEILRECIAMLKNSVPPAVTNKANTDLTALEARLKALEGRIEAGENKTQTGAELNSIIDGLDATIGDITSATSEPGIDPDAKALGDELGEKAEEHIGELKDAVDKAPPD